MAFASGQKDVWKMSRNYPASMAPRNTRKATKVVIERVTQEKKKLRSVVGLCVHNTAGDN